MIMLGLGFHGKGGNGGGRGAARHCTVEECHATVQFELDHVLVGHRQRLGIAIHPVHKVTLDQSA
jgi:hypothetical protein